MSMFDYIVEFEQLNKKCTNLKIDTDALLALKLLYNANLTEHQNMNLLILTAMGKILSLLFFYKDGFGIK